MRTILLRSIGLSAILAFAACNGDDDETEAPDTDTGDTSDTDETDTDETDTDETDTDETDTDETDTEPPGEPLDLTILHVNDHHSHLQPETFSLDVSALGLTTAGVTSVNVSYGGMPMIIDQILARQDDGNVLKLHAGDAITGTLYYSLFSGEADAALMNLACFDAFTLGNHEFDDGDSGLAKFLDFLAEGDCDTPVLSANVVPGATSAIKTGYIQSDVVVDVDGQQVGIIGLTIAGKTKNSSRPDKDTNFLDEVATAQKVIDAQRAAGVDKIILLTHYTYAGDLALAKAVSGVDVIVGGDSHSLLGGSSFETLGFNPVGDYPTQVTNKDGEPVCVVQAWEYAHVLGELEVSFDADGVVTKCGGTPILPISDVYRYGSGSSAGTLAGDDQAKVTAFLTALPEVLVGTPNAEAVAALTTLDAEINELTLKKIGSSSTNLCLDRFPNEGRSSVCARSETYARGSDISNLVAKAFLTVTPTADIAIQNGGGVRVDIRAGDHTIADAFKLLPFRNTLVTLDLTGAEVKAVLEDALANTLDSGGSTGSYPYASGLRYEVDASKAKGSRISKLEVNPRLTGTWTAIDPAATYTVATNNFIAEGRDGYATFGVVFAAGRYVDTYTEYAQGWIDFVEAETAAGRTLAKLPAAEYSTQRYIGRTGCDHSARTDCSGY